MDREAYLNSVNLRDGTSFPYLVLDVINDESYPRNPGFQVMHWHEDLQFIYVLEGEVQVVTLTDCVSLGQGEGVFINKNVVHLVRKVGTCHYNSFIFPDCFLKFYPGSPAERMVEKIVGCPELSALAIPAVEENALVLRALRQLWLLEKKRAEETYFYEVLVSLCSLWLAFCQTVKISDTQPHNRVLEARAAIFLQYIAAHFGEDVTLQTLAASASVSKSECLRCFKTVLHTTPYRYLTEYRLAWAARQLRQTEQPVTAIALAAGFNQSSHFGKCFREKTGFSPSEYRKRR